MWSLAGATTKAVLNAWQVSTCQSVGSQEKLQILYVANNEIKKKVKYVWYHDRCYVISRLKVSIPQCAKTLAPARCSGNIR